MKTHMLNTLTAIKNGQLARKKAIKVKKVNACAKILQILWDSGFILGYKADNLKYIIYFKYSTNGNPAVSNLKIISKPGSRLYYSVKQIWKLDGESTTLILSTNQGLKSISECKRLRLGGEPLASIN